MRELLHFEDERDAPDPDYAGYGWARVDELWLDDQRVTDALVLALHSADDGEAMPDDIELEFELPDAAPVSVPAEMFLDKWLPELPRASSVVLALCNPHRAALRKPAGVETLYYANGDVESWLDRDGVDRIRLASEHGWVRKRA